MQIKQKNPFGIVIKILIVVVIGVVLYLNYDNDSFDNFGGPTFNKGSNADSKDAIVPGALKWVDPFPNKGSDE